MHDCEAAAAAGAAHINSQRKKDMWGDKTGVLKLKRNTYKKRWHMRVRCRDIRVESSSLICSITAALSTITEHFRKITRKNQSYLEIQIHCHWQSLVLTLDLDSVSFVKFTCFLIILLPTGHFLSIASCYILIALYCGFLLLPNDGDRAPKCMS